MTDPEQPPRSARRRRLLYRASHRGTRETDLLVGGYVASRIDTSATRSWTRWKPCWNCPTPTSPTG